MQRGDRAMTTEELRAARFRFLRALYEASGGSQWEWPEANDIAVALGFDRELTARITDYLADEGLIQYRALGGIIGITHQGIREVEDAVSHPDKPTQYFPAVNVINIGSLVGSSILQGSPGSHQSTRISHSGQRELAVVLAEIRQSIERLGLDAQQQTDLEGDIGTVEAQLTTSKPKSSIVRECLSSIRGLLEKAGGAVATGLAGKLVE